MNFVNATEAIVGYIACAMHEAISSCLTEMLIVKANMMMMQIYFSYFQLKKGLPRIADKID